MTTFIKETLHPGESRHALFLVGPEQNVLYKAFADDRIKKSSNR